MPVGTLNILGGYVQRRNIAAEAAVGRAGFNIRGICFRHRKMYAAVCSRDVETISFPAVTGQHHIHTTVCRTASHIAGHIFKLNTAVERFKLNSSIYGADSDPAVVGFQIEIGKTRNEYLVGNSPILIAR